MGAIPRPLRPVEGRGTTSLNVLFAHLENDVFSMTWPLDETTRLRAAAATRAWALERYGDLDACLDLPLVIRWRAYDLT